MSNIIKCLEWHILMILCLLSKYIVPYLGSIFAKFTASSCQMRKLRLEPEIVDICQGRGTLRSQSDQSGVPSKILRTRRIHGVA